MVTQFFGQRWDAPRVDGAAQVDTPAGEPCLHCDEPIADGDRGLLMPVRSTDRVEIRPVHLECDLRSTLSHWMRQCRCFVPDRGLRDEARATLEAVNAQRARHGFGPM
jgi:hypothetical protein